MNRVDNSKGKLKPCWRCGKKGHTPDTCRYKEAKCHKCSEVGHLRYMCRKPKHPIPDSKKPAKEPVKDDKRKKGKRRVCHLSDDEGTDEESSEEEATRDYPFYVTNIQAGSKKSPPLEVDLEVDGVEMKMELDTGAAYTLVSEKTFQKLWPGKDLSTTHVRLRAYTGDDIPVVGSREVKVTYQTQNASLQLLVVRGEGPSLFGRNWLDKIRLDWPSVNKVESALDKLLDKHQVLFTGGLGKLKGFQTSITVDPEAPPKYYRARPVPYAMRAKVEEELQRLVSEGVIKPIQYSEWASPIVPVLKPNGKVRIQGNCQSCI